MNVVGVAGWIVGWIRQDLSSVEHVRDRPHKVMCKGPGVSLSVMGTAYRMEWSRTGPVDGAELCIKGKVKCVTEFGNNTASCGSV